MTLKTKAEQSKQDFTALFSCSLFMCEDGDDCWLPHVIIVTADDGSFVSQWCNRRRWTFPDPSPNYTLRTREEPITRERLGLILSNRGSHVWLPVRYVAAVVLL